MVTGIPNVGKSSLINSLRTNNLGKEQKAVLEGARPGVTVSVFIIACFAIIKVSFALQTRLQNRVRILDKPPIYMYVAAKNVISLLHLYLIAHIYALF